MLYLNKNHRVTTAMNKQTLLAQINNKLSKTIATIDHHAKKTLLKKISSTLDHAIRTCDDKWITVNGGSKKDGEGGGSHILLDDNGHIKAGAGGKFNGKPLNSMGGTKKFTKYETNAERAGVSQKQHHFNEAKKNILENLESNDFGRIDYAAMQIKSALNNLWKKGMLSRKEKKEMEALISSRQNNGGLFNDKDFERDKYIKALMFISGKMDNEFNKNATQQSSTNKPSQEATQGAGQEKAQSTKAAQRAFHHGDEHNIFGEKIKSDAFGRREEKYKNPNYIFSKMEHDFTDKDMNKIDGWRYKYNNDSGKVMVSHESNEESAAGSFKNMDAAREFVAKKEQQKDQAKKHANKVHEIGEDILIKAEKGDFKTKKELKDYAASINFDDVELRDNVHNYLFKNGLASLMNNLPDN